MAQIPLWRAGEIIAHAIVDSADLALVDDQRWRMITVGRGRRYAARTNPRGAPRYVLMHRLILGLQGSTKPHVDHRNGDGLDNRRENLRPCTEAENQQNQRPQLGRSSQYRGVYWNRKSLGWIAHAKLGGKTFTLGWFTSELEAAYVASAWRAEHMPFAVETLPEYHPSEAERAQRAHLSRAIRALRTWNRRYAALPEAPTIAAICERLEGRLMEGLA